MENLNPHLPIPPDEPGELPSDDTAQVRPSTVYRPPMEIVRPQTRVAPARRLWGRLIALALAAGVAGGSILQFVYRKSAGYDAITPRIHRMAPPRPHLAPTPVVVKPEVKNHPLQKKTTKKTSKKKSVKKSPRKPWLSK